MEATFKLIASWGALFCEFAAVAVLVQAAAEAVLRLFLAIPHWNNGGIKKAIWVRFAGGIILGLEFTLAADIIDTAITPSWNDIGQLAAIAAIRTGLNYFLERDIEVFDKAGAGPAPGPAA